MDFNPNMYGDKLPWEADNRKRKSVFDPETTTPREVQQFVKNRKIVDAQINRKPKTTKSYRNRVDQAAYNKPRGLSRYRDMAFYDAMRKPQMKNDYYIDMSVENDANIEAYRYYHKKSDKHDDKVESLKEQSENLYESKPNETNASKKRSKRPTGKLQYSPTINQYIADASNTNAQ